MRPSHSLAITAVIVLTAVGFYQVHKSLPEFPVMAGTSSNATAAIPTPQYLFEHPDVLKDAEQKCQNGSDPSSLYCSNVHKAESLRMADQYRRAAAPKGAAK